MKSFWCGAVIPDCDTRFVGRDEPDVLRQVAEHAAGVHGLDDLPAATVDRVRRLISDISE
ncbi:hypothetical protein GOPIP_057_00660 [Gordonia polyisoprenivorans NBRC 16320 = JCM 10675]|uniref:DUF1059 domain-containing protein n=1 Tax=Gordonia polyisoprenivorans TaxID=84595 RepID=A0A846WJX2_9ACTN|nr:DUF1059 domain-containing protein [Gordonia polyisoprenivorans]NKY01982.1 DUF1059 domain-containing protein [Gordonia polyisoprenivorans]GAB23748.1 hypothetical protein GOPIP_057_00660 [Gordonia polyisoprenivorans NBRC 16320 = JCM 10675]